MTPDKREYWTLGNSLNGQTVFPTSNFISIPFSLEGFTPRHKITAQLIHNIWGYNINLTIYKGNSILLNLDNQDNFKSTNTDQFYEIHSLLPKELCQYSEFLVQCPLPTLITKQNRIDQNCRNDKYFCPLRGHFALISIGDIMPTTGNYTLNVFSSKFLLNNFIETPQIYLGFWKNSDSNSLLIAGSIITSIGLLLLIAAVVIFFLYFIRTNE